MKRFVLAGSTVSSARCLVQYQGDKDVVLSHEAAKAGEALAGNGVWVMRAPLPHNARAGECLRIAWRSGRKPPVDLGSLFDDNADPGPCAPTE